MAAATLRPATEDDTKSAMFKIQRAAASYNPDVFMGPITRSFEANELNPTAFREALKQNFGIHLSAEELDAALKM